MAYRKILVDNKEYEYTVGKTHVKIRGMQAVPIELIAAKVHGDRLSVIPLRIATYIKLGYIPRGHPGSQCSRGGKRRTDEAHRRGKKFSTSGPDDAKL